jgi:predicted TPR repeat methyltransferase
MRSLKMFARAGLALSLLAMTVLLATAADEKKKEDEKGDVIYVPTPQEVVEAMLKLAKVGKKDVVYDLGCGDGRIVLTAARQYGVKATGFDVSSERMKECKENMKKEKEATQKLVTFKQENIFKQDLSGASVITLYLLPSLNAKLAPQ